MAWGTCPRGHVTALDQSQRQHCVANGVARRGSRVPIILLLLCLFSLSGWMDQHGTWHESRPQPRGLCVRWGPNPLLKGSTAPHQFLTSVYCGQTAAWIKMSLRTEVGLVPDNIVLDEDPAPLPKKAAEPPSSIFSPCPLLPNGWMEVGLGSGHVVLDGDRAPLPKKGADRALQFSAHVYCGQTAAWIMVTLGTDRGCPRFTRHCVRWGPSFPYPKGAHPQFSANVRCGQMAGWTKMPLGMEVCLGPGDFVFDGDPATPRRKGAPLLPNFWPMSVVDKRLDESRCHLVRR